jgi:PDZ domain/PEGA domain
MNSLGSVRNRAGAFPRCFIVIVAVLSALLSVQIFAAQESHKPLGEKEVIDLLTNDVPPPRVAELAEQFGISFQVTSSVELKLKGAGATDDLIEALRQLSPKQVAPPASKPPSPTSAAPVLEITSSPGDAQVYVDDEPVGTTSPEGRLKLTTFAPGEHKVRVSHAGYRDIEQMAQLVAGQTASVSASLEPVQQSNPPAAPPPSTASSEGESTLPPGTLGLFLTPTEGGEEGMSVGAVVPGSPADSAGLRPGDIVLSVGSQLIKNAQDVTNVLAGHRKGDKVEVTFKNSTGVQTRSVQLAGPAILAGLVRFRVNHDHGSSYCTGWMTIIGGRIVYVGDRPSAAGVPVHSFSFATGDIRQVARNPFYLAIFAGFHIRLKDGTNMNFVEVNAKGVAQRPEQLIEAIRRARAQD